MEIKEGMIIMRMGMSMEIRHKLRYLINVRVMLRYSSMQKHWQEEYTK